MKKNIFLLVSLFVAQTIFAQDEVKWVHSFGRSSLNGTGIYNIHLQENHSFYYLGGFGDRQDFDFSLEGEDIAYVNENNPNFGSFFGLAFAKYDIDSNLLWVKRTRLFSNTISFVDSELTDEHIYIVGGLSTSFDADFNETTYYLNKQSSATSNAFIGKYDLEGNLIKARVLRSSTASHISSIKADFDGNIFIYGSFQVNLNLDINGNTTTNLVSSSGLGYNPYLIKMDSDFNVIYAKTFTTTANAYIRDIDIDSLGNVYIAGTFGGDLDINPDEGEQIISTSGNSSESFVIKLNQQGLYQWGYHLPVEEIRALKLDDEGNIYLGGHFKNTVDFSMNGSEATETAYSGNDLGFYLNFQNAYLAKYNSSAEFQWVDFQYQPAHTYVQQIDIVGNDIRVVGNFVNTTTFSNGETIDIVNTQGNFFPFILQYNKQGVPSFLFAITGDDGGSNDFTRISRSASNMLVYGFFRNTDAEIINFNSGFEQPPLTISMNPNSQSLYRYIFRIADKNLSTEDDSIEKPNIMVYPNPSIGIINVEIPNESIGSSCELYSLLGQKVHSGVLTNNSNIIDVNLASGVYLLKVTSDSNIIYSQKIIIR